MFIEVPSFEINKLYLLLTFQNNLVSNIINLIPYKPIEVVGALL